MAHSLNKPSFPAQDQNSPYDALIVGQGLAGSLLAWEMIQQGQRVFVIDNHHHGSSSRVAAGIINPITGHRVNLTHRFTEFFTVANDTYRQLSKTLGAHFFTAVQQQRLIKNPGQQRYYEQRLEQTEYRAFIDSPSYAENDSSPFLQPEFGVGHIQQTYRVDTQTLLDAMTTWLQDQQALLHLALDYTDLKIDAEQVQLQTANLHLSVKRVIFCEGFQAIHNPWFKGLPFKLAKGEILTVELNHHCETMLNWGNWLLPAAPETQEKRTALLGASYTWHDTSLDCDDNIGKQLLKSLETYTHFQGKIMAHRAGIRPTTINRQPLIGIHPQHSKLYCFNGFGSKGCLIIPHYAKQFTRHFSQQKALTTLLPELEATLPLNP